MAETILLIDYDPRSIGRIRHLLEAGGYRMEVARDGVAGIRAFEQLGPRLTLIEALLPKKHGFEVCHHLKASLQGKERAVVLITGRTRGHRQGLRWTGCDACLEKPFTDDALMNVVRETVGEGETAPAAEPPLPGPRAIPFPRRAEPDRRPAARPRIPVELTEDDISARLDTLLTAAPEVPPAAPLELAAGTEVESAVESAPEEAGTPPPAPDGAAPSRPKRKGSKRSKKSRAKKKTAKADAGDDAQGPRPRKRRRRSSRASPATAS